MKLGKFTLTEWTRGYGGWFKYDALYVKEGTFAIALYHNLFESLDTERKIHENPELQLPVNSIYDPNKPVLWTIHNEPGWFSDMYYNLYEPSPMTAEEMKNTIDKFIIRIDKLIIFS